VTALTAGDDGTTVSRVTEERERAGQKIAKCGERERKA
jgi:hypothetical protein